MFRLLPETSRDTDEVETLFDLAFAPGRTALSAYQLRDGVPPVGPLCRIARDEYDALVGAIRYWPVRIGGGDAAASGSADASSAEQGHPALLLGPVAVHPTRQGEGLGALLIGETLARATELGWRLAILVGDAPYYARVRFLPVAERGISFPPPINPARLLARELVPGALDGVTGQVRRWQGPLAQYSEDLPDSAQKLAES